MKIKYLSGPKAGQEDQVQNQIGYALVNAGLAELVEADAPPKRKFVTAPGVHGDETYVLPTHEKRAPATPAWEVTTYQGANRKFLAIKMQILGQTTFYSGLPDKVSKIGGWQVPAEIRALYAKQYRAHPALRDQQAAAAQTPEHLEDENAMKGRIKKIRDGELCEREQTIRTDLLAGRGFVVHDPYDDESVDVKI